MRAHARTAGDIFPVDVVLFSRGPVEVGVWGVCFVEVHGAVFRSKKLTCSPALLGQPAQEAGRTGTAPSTKTHPACRTQTHLHFRAPHNARANFSCGLNQDWSLLCLLESRMVHLPLFTLERFYSN